MNKISIIIPAFNAAQYIKETLESVLSQTFTCFEIIVIDDGSTDETAEIVKSFDDKRLIYIYQVNTGLAGARNTGIKASQGEFIAFLDADDIWVPDKLEKQIRLFDDESVGITYTGCVKINHNSEPILRNSPDKFFRGDVYKNIIYDNFIPASSVMLKKELLTRNALYFRTGRQGVEDWDLWIRLSRFVYFDYISEPLLKYRVTPNNMSSNYLKMYDGKMTALNDCIDTISCDDLLSDHNKKTLIELAIKSKALQTLRTGHELLSDHRKKLSREFFMRAISFNPASIANYWGLLKSYIAY